MELIYVLVRTANEGNLVFREYSSRIKIDRLSCNHHYKRPNDDFTSLLNIVSVSTDSNESVILINFYFFCKGGYVVGGICLCDCLVLIRVIKIC